MYRPSPGTGALVVAMAEDDTTVLDAADVPVLQVVLSGSPRAAWEESQRGLSPADLAMIGVDDFENLFRGTQDD